MGKYISLGEYNKLYKYIWIYLAIRFVMGIIFDYQLIFDQFLTEIFEEPDMPFITLQIIYIFIIIISTIVLIIKNCLKKNGNKKDNVEQKLIFNKKDINIDCGVLKNDYFLYINFFFVTSGNF